MRIAHSLATARTARLMLAAGIILALAGGATAQQRPLVTQDPQPIGAGQVLAEAGFDYGMDVHFPASGLKGSLLRAPLLGVTVGVSPIAEIQISGGPYARLGIASRQSAPLSDMLALDENASSTSDVEDLVIGAKIRLVAEGASTPGLAFRFATRLPNASNESGLGLDTTDFHAAFLFGKTIQSIRFVGNLGLGILGDPTRGDRQNDVLTYGASVARAITGQLDIVGELNGRASLRSGEPPAGTESRGALRAGVRYTRGPARVDAGLIVGTTSRDPSLGFTAGLTYVFNAFQVR